MFVSYSAKIRQKHSLHLRKHHTKDFFCGPIFIYPFIVNTGQYISRAIPLRKKSQNSGPSVINQKLHVLHHICEMNFIEDFHNQTTTPTRPRFHFEYTDNKNIVQTYVGSVFTSIRYILIFQPSYICALTFSTAFVKSLCRLLSVSSCD